MKYERIEIGRFIERPNRFIAYVEIAGKKETVHVKNTGRCAELLTPNASVYVQRAENPDRKTQWDLIGVKKGKRMINMDSQIPNKVVEEWIKQGNLFPDAIVIRPEKTYRKSRFDLYVEEGDRKIFVEVKGVTLEENGIVKFPDAPTERGIKHIEELCEATKEGYEAYIFFVIQMKGVRYFTPNMETQPAFGEALKRAKEQGVHVLAYDCKVGKDSIEIGKEVPVLLEDENLKKIADPLVTWYRENKRELPWREQISAYRVWVSEIMLQQTRVEAVKPFYARFLNALPTVKDLAEAEEDQLLKLWEGLGYYNRVRNMQKAAKQIMEDFHGEFPKTYEEIKSLTGIGNYTAGAISSFAFGIPKPAVDGNVLRVISRITASYDDIMKNVAIRKRPAKGLLAGLYELPNIEGELSADEALEYSKKIGLQPLRIKELGAAKHIFSHVEWHMTGFAIRVDELEKSCTEKMLFIHPEEVQREYPIPAAFEYYTDFVDIKLGQEKYEE